MRRFTGLKRAASAKSNGRSSVRHDEQGRYPKYAVCIDNRGNEASLQIGRIYRVIRPMKNDPPRMIRVIDEECEDYLYGASQFEIIDASARNRRAISTLST